MRKVKRIRLRHGKMARWLVLMDGPTPQIGDLCTIKGQDWVVIKVEDTEIIAEFSTAQGRLKQVFPWVGLTGGRQRRIYNVMTQAPR